jgi:hypothetical protein
MNKQDAYIILKQDTDSTITLNMVNIGTVLASRKLLILTYLLAYVKDKNIYLKG